MSGNIERLPNIIDNANDLKEAIIKLLMKYKLDVNTIDVEVFPLDEQFMIYIDGSYAR